MRPDQHKKKRSAQYKKKHGIQKDSITKEKGKRKRRDEKGEDQNSTVSTNVNNPKAEQNSASIAVDVIIKSMCNRIYLTRVLADYDCDTFFPEFDTKLYQQISDPDVNGEVQEDKGIQFKFEIYERS